VGIEGRVSAVRVRDTRTASQEKSLARVGRTVPERKAIWEPFLRRVRIKLPGRAVLALRTDENSRDRKGGAGQ